MRLYQYNQFDDRTLRKSIREQTCVIAIQNSDLPEKLKSEIESFIIRNTLEDCGKVPPCCLKAHSIKTAKALGLHNKIPIIKKLFKTKDHDDYYLDNGELHRI